MLFSTPIVREQVKLDPRFASAETVTDEDLALLAMERRGLRDLELMRYVNSMLNEAGKGYFAFRLYNGSGERLWLDRDAYPNGRSIWKYPPDLMIDPGQWSVIVVEKNFEDKGMLCGDIRIGYKGDASDVRVHWGIGHLQPLALLHVPNASPSDILTTGGAVPSGTVPTQVALASRGKVAMVRRGHAGANVIVDCIYSTCQQFPHLTIQL